MTNTPTQVTIRILEKEYQVACPPHEKPDLIAASELLNGKMRQIRDTGRVVGLDRVAIMAALNLANELLKTQGQEHEFKEIINLSVQSMQEQLDSALGTSKQLSL
jgi:cell division protein ZapA